MKASVNINQGILRRQTMSRSEYRRASKETESGTLIRLKAGVYASPETLFASWVDIDKIVPGGILCLYSAWAFHRLTTQIPDAFYVAVRSKRRIVLPELLDIHLVYVSDSILNLGVEISVESGVTLQLYDCERSVCDAIKYRNKIGIDVMAEILKCYLGRSERDIKKLMEYASKLRVLNTLKKYLEIYL